MRIYNDESIFIDFVIQNGKIEDGFNAEYKIVRKSDKEIVKTGYLTKSNDKKYFKLRIKSSTMKKISPDEYILQVAVVNNELGYKDYIFETELEIIDV